MKTIKNLGFGIAMLAVLIIICFAAASPLGAEKIYPTINTDELKALFDKKQLIQLAYPNIYQTLLADWKDMGLAVEK